MIRCERDVRPDAIHYGRPQTPPASAETWELTKDEVARALGEYVLRRLGRAAGEHSGEVSITTRAPDGVTRITMTIWPIEPEEVERSP